MSLWIKICGIRDEATALLCAELGADAVGFVFAPSPRQVDVALATGICRALPSKLEKIGVFTDAPVDVMWQTARQAGLTAVQCHYLRGGDAPFSNEFEIIPAFAADVLGQMDLHLLSGRRYVVDSPSGPGSGRAWDYVRAASQGRTILAGGLAPENIAAAIAGARPWGIDVSSGVEARRGVKDPARIKDFIAAARAAQSEET